MSLWVDRRGQSVVIGSLLIFTFLIIAFSSYQAFVVPSQNQQIEAEHFQETEDSFSELRSSIVNAVGTDSSRSTSLRLGTRYPTRAIALNPPAAAGRLETTGGGNVDFDTSQNVCRGDSGPVTTRSLVYTPSYNEYGEPRAIGYESRLVSREFRGGSVYDQRLVRSASDDDQISLYLLTGEVSENGVESYTLEVNGSNRYSTTVTNPTITIPSRFNATQWEEDILEDRSDIDATDVNGGDRVELDFDGGDYTVSCAVVGLDSDPAFTPPSSGGGGGDGGGNGGDNNYGQGSESTYSSDDDTETVSVPNGKWNGITALDEIILYNGETVYNTSQPESRIEYTLTFRNTETGENYTVRYVATTEPSNSPTQKVVFDDQVGSQVGADPNPVAYRNVTENTTAYGGADLLDPTTYNDRESDVNQSIQDIKSLASPDLAVITSEIKGRVDVTIREEALFSATQPQPDDDPDLEFVRVDFESPTNTTGWTFENGANEETSLPSTELSEDVYFAANETAFEDERGFTDDKVYPLATGLPPGGESLALLDSQGRTRDEMGYNGRRTEKGNWTIQNIDSGDVAVRKQFDRSLQDNDSEADWRSDPQASFFATTTTSVAYVPESSGDEIRTVDTSGTVRTYGSDSPAPSVLGPKSDVDGDGVDEVPYVDGNGALKFMESNGTVATLASNADTDRSVGIGNRDGDDTTDVYYVGGSGTELYVVQDGGTPEELQAIDSSTAGNNEESISAVAVYGDADIDGEGDVETVFQHNDTHIGYVDYGTGPSDKNETVFVEIDGTAPAAPAIGVGEPLTFDGEVQVPVVDGDNGIVLVNETGATAQVLDGNNRDTAKGAPVAPIDWTDDGSSELVFINDNDNQNLYYVSPADGPTETGTQITDTDGNKVAAAGKGVR